MEHVDVLIVGAGLSGIGAALPPAGHCPGKTYAILEARETHRRHLGPVPLSRHPLRLGHVTLGYSFRPWTRGQGDRRRPVDPASTSARPPREYGIDAAHPLQPPGRSRAAWSRATTRAGRSRRERTRHRRDRASSPATSSSCAAATTATTRATRPTSRASSASRADRPPAALARDLDYAGKRVVVIGSGATAVTLVPAHGRDGRARDDAAALADATSSRCPAEDPLADSLRRVLPGAGRLRPRALEERAARHALLPAQPPRARAS